jgi:Cof subfamily protein (haloacid dehalogenase superfamily)
MSYKIVAIDLDDTLINSNHEITQHTMEAIKKAVEKNVDIVLATGRTFMGVKRFVDLLELKSPVITAGGATINDYSGKPIFESPVPHEIVKKLLSYAKEHGLHAQIYSNTEYYFFKDNDYARVYGEIYGFPGIARPELLSEPDLSTPKVLFIAEPEKIIELQSELTRLFPRLHNVRSKPQYLELTNPEATKGGALAYLAQIKGCTREEVIAIGDGEIDISMIQYAGLGVAMANALPNVLEIADMITRTNDEDGVAYVLEKYVLEE